MLRFPDASYDRMWSRAMASRRRKSRGRPPLDTSKWAIRAAACALISHYQQQMGCTLTEAATRALAAWPRRSLPAPKVQTLLAHHRRFKRRRIELRERPSWPAEDEAEAAADYSPLRGTAEDEAAAYYGALRDFASDDPDNEVAVRRLFVIYAADKIPST